MKFLKNLHILSENKNDLSSLTDDIMSKVQSNIRKGAQDLEQKWANALELVHKAYEITGIQRPEPDMKGAWAQYETNIQYAVQQLSRTRGIAGDWRMSSSMFHESMERVFQYHISSSGADSSETYKVTAKNIDDIIKKIKEEHDDYDVSANRVSDQKATITFSKWGIQKNHRLDIEQIV